MAVRAGFTTILTAFWSFRLSIAQDASCAQGIQSPVSVPIRNVSLGGNLVRRGLDFDLGTPPQSFSLMVSGNNNITVIYDSSGQCTDITLDDCTNIRGGAFVESDSSTFSSMDLSRLTSQDSFIKDNYLAGLDTMTLSNTLQVKTFPFTIPRDGTVDNSQLGLGPESDFLNALKSLGKIASRSYSLFWGQTGIDPSHQMDGALVLGGLDKAKTSSQNYTGDIVRGAACATSMVLPLTDMALVFPNGTSASLLDGAQGQTVNYCIDPEYPIITMNGDQWQKWLILDPGSNTQPVRAGAWPNLWGLLYDPSVAFTGDLKITINNQLDITIPNHQLVQHYVFFGKDGELTLNDTVRELMINPLEDINNNDMPKFGMTFLSAAYLNVNYDENQFTVWQANPTTNEELVGFGNSVEGCPSTTSGGAASSSTGSSPVTSSSGSSSNSSKISGGAIAGIVLGAIAVTAAVALGLFVFCLRRRRDNRKNEQESSSNPQSKSLFSAYGHKAELEDSATAHKSMGSGNISDYRYQPIDASKESDGSTQPDRYLQPHIPPVKSRNTVIEMPA